MNNQIVIGFLTVLLIPLALMLILCLVRAIKGPRTADRIVATNMMGTMTIVIIAILALILEEGYLVDICIIYAMISFLAVIVLTKVYLGIYLKQKEDKAVIDKLHEVHQGPTVYETLDGKGGEMVNVKEEEI